METPLEKGIGNYNKKNGGSNASFTVPWHKHNGSDSPRLNIADTVVSPNFGVPFANGLDSYNMYIQSDFSTAGFQPLIIEPNQEAFSGGNAILYIGKGNPYSTSVQIFYTNLVGTFGIGEQVTGNITLAKGNVSDDNGNFIYVINVIGQFRPGETITGTTSGATAEIVSIQTVTQALPFNKVRIYTRGNTADQASIYSEASEEDSPALGVTELKPDLFRILLGNTSDESMSMEMKANSLIFTPGLPAPDFAIQLPDTTRPAPIAGMIAFEGGTFYACEVTGTWKQIVTV